MKALPGTPAPPGATWDGGGTNFSVFSANATSIELLLFDGLGSQPAARVPMASRTGYFWHAYLPGVSPGQLYAFSVDGPYQPSAGHRFNRNKSLLDPYAKAIEGTVAWDESVFGYKAGGPDSDLSFNPSDSSQYTPKSVVVDPAFDWRGDRAPATPWNETVIYELHVKGFSKLNPDVEVGLRGTYAGLASPASVRHLRELGVTAVELLPTHQHVDNKFLLDKGLSNYWGYNTIGFFAPDSRYSASGGRGQQVTEFKAMVRELHSAGLEVILDVVYNHTAEGNQFGPTLCFKGIDNSAYYKLRRGDMRNYFDATGTGNTLNTRNPFVVQMVMDSLRYWAGEMHVDGFRFDLAPALARERYEVDFKSALFQAIYQDPLLSRVKLIAEPWDLGHAGNQQGKFPPPWGEWNGRFRDTTRRFWKGDGVPLSELATRLSGSSDLYSWQRRGPLPSVNFVTCHDGFTLRDLVSYDRKHNEPNGEGNKDGADLNLSWNCGQEGESREPAVVELRSRQARNFLAALLLSQGVPMLTAGDELGRSQKGNNNAYCQDNETSWVDWEGGPERQSSLAFVKSVVRLRLGHPVFRRTEYLRGVDGGGGGKDVTWLAPDGSEVGPDGWGRMQGRALGFLLSGADSGLVRPTGEPIKDETFAVLLNGSPDRVTFRLPGQDSGWQVVLDTASPTPMETTDAIPSGEALLAGRSLVVLRKVAR
jgi:isoamylase